MGRTRKPISPSQDEIWIVDLNPAVGHEQGGVRPVLVVSDDQLNHSRADLVMVVPITGTDRGLVTHVPIRPPEGGLLKPSFIMTDQLRTVSVLRFGKRLGLIRPTTRSEVEARLRFLLTLR
jgi:mRNA interferase MazF